MTSDTNDNDRYLVPGLVRGVDILRLFTLEKRKLTMPEITAALGIPRSTVHRLIVTLEHLQLLQKDPYSPVYSLGSGLLRLGFQYIAQQDLVEIGRAHVDRLALDSGFSAQLVIRDQAEVVVLHRAAGRSAFASALTVGSRLPAHATVLGRMLLINASYDELLQVFGDGELTRFTDETPKTLADLEGLLQADRQRQYAVSEAAFEPGIHAIAAPVYGPDGTVVAAINITMGVGKNQFDKAPLVAMVRAQAQQLSHHLGSPEQLGQVV